MTTPITSQLDAIRVYSDFDVVTTNFTFETYATGTATAAYIGNIVFPKIIGTVIPNTWVKIDNLTNILRIVQNSSPIDVTIPYGTGLSPIYIAHVITNSIKVFGLWCDFFNGQFRITSNSASDVLSIGTPSNNAATALGLAAPTISSGSTNSNSYSGAVTFNNTYLGVAQATYWIQVSGNEVFSVIPNSGNYYKGTVSTGGNYNTNTSASYQVTVNATQGHTAENGKMFTPTFSVTSSLGLGDSTPTNCEILYYNHWYEIGTHGVRIKFSEYPFKTGDTFQIDCLPPQTADGTNNTANETAAKFVVLSTDGTGNPVPTQLVGGVLPLTKGMSISFANGTFTKGDTFIINGFGPTYTEVSTIDLGISGQGEQGAYGFVRLIAKEGVHRLDWCKIGLKSTDTMIDYGYGESMFDVGVLGGTAKKNSCELPSSFATADIPALMADYVSFVPLDSSVVVGCGTPLFATDFWYFSLLAGVTEATQEFYPAFTLYYNYK